MLLLCRLKKIMRKIKLILVDDELFFLNMLRTVIDWSEFGIEIVATANNGELALSLIEKYRPDIVITDMKMPVVDGIELMKRTSSAYPKTKFIVMSGYDDFMLVKQSFKLGTAEYILKSEFDKNEFELILKKLCAEIHQGIIKKVSHVIISEQERKSIFFKRHIESAGAVTEQIINNFKNMNLNFTGRNTVCMGIIVNNFKTAVSSYNEREQTLRYGILNVLHELLAEAGDIILWKKYFIAVLTIPSGASCESYCTELFTKLKNTLNETLNLCISGGLSNFYSQIKSFSDLHRLCTEAYNASEYYYFNKKGTLSSINCKKNQLNQVRFDYTLFHNILNHPDSKEALIQINDLLINPRNVTPKNMADVKRGFNVYYSIIMNKVIMLGLSSELKDDMEEYESKIKHEGDIFDANTWLSNILKKIISSDENNSIVARTIRYINQNYSNKELSLTMIADALSISNSYLSRIFSNTQGIGISEYIIKVRIAEAVKLIDKSRHRICEISEMVGYNNSEYFSKSFKNIMHQSPKQYMAKKQKSQIPKGNNK